MVYRHSFIARATHLTFFIAFLALELTGAQLKMHRHWLAVNSGHVHQYAGIAMILSGVIYVGNGLISGELSKLLFRGEDAAGLWPMIAYYLRLRKTAPIYDDYNPLQKLSYTIVLLVIGPLIALTGLAIWNKLGGRTIGLLHLIMGLELVAFFFGHLVMVAATGLYNNLRSMVTGWYQAPAVRLAGIRAPSEPNFNTPRRERRQRSA